MWGVACGVLTATIFRTRKPGVTDRSTVRGRALSVCSRTDPANCFWPSRTWDPIVQKSSICYSRWCIRGKFINACLRFIRSGGRRSRVSVGLMILLTPAWPHSFYNGKIFKLVFHDWIATVGDSFWYVFRERTTFGSPDSLVVPFSDEVWIYTILSSLLVAACLFCAMKAENSADRTWALLEYTVGSLSQQGNSAL